MYIDKDKIVIGKNILESLTTGMYADSEFLYREYIQNSSDAIDKALETGLISELREGKIHILIDADDITIKDNGTGISSDDVIERLAHIADSNKDRTKEKGFRGIGRLGGIGYCNTLKFITSFKGEDTQTVFAVDCIKLKEILYDESKQISAADCFSSCLEMDINDESIDEHYFTVYLGGVTDKKLLDTKKIRKYLSQIAPLPYNNAFKFKDTILNKLHSLDKALPVYDTYVNNDRIFKGYTANIKGAEVQGSELVDEVREIKFHEVRKGDELISLLWYSISKFTKVINLNTNKMAGIRLRQWNIQIGDETNLKKLFNEDRGNMYYFGEIFCFSDKLIANARRDSFNPNDTQDFLYSNLERFFQHLSSLYRKSSQLRNYIKIKDEINSEVEKYNEKAKTGFTNQKEHEEAKSSINVKRKTFEENIKKVDRMKEDGSEEIEILQDIYEDDLEAFNVATLARIETKRIPEKDVKISVMKTGDINIENILSKIQLVLDQELPQLKATYIYNKIKDTLQ